MALNLDELMIGDIILNDDGKPCVVEGLYRNQIYTNKGVYLPFEVDPMPLSKEFLLANGFNIIYESDSGNQHFLRKVSSGGVFMRSDDNLTVLNDSKIGRRWAFSVSNPEIGSFSSIDTRSSYLYNVHDLQHAIKVVNLNITLTCQQSS